MTDLPPNVYRLPQRAFDAIPGSPWVYWIPDGLRRLFEELPGLGEVAQPRQGTATSDNARFLRFWWEIGWRHIALGCYDRVEARASGKKWFPYMKGGAYHKWYGNQDYVVNWGDDSAEIAAFDRAVIRNPDYYFREGVTYSYLTSAAFSARYSPGGFVFDVAGSSLFPDDMSLVLSVMNSSFAAYALKLINPTVNFQVGDLARLPIPTISSDDLQDLTRQAIALAETAEQQDETTFDFVAPPRWDTGLDDLTTAQARLTALESQIDDEVYCLYDISDEDRAAIEAELGFTNNDLRFTGDNSNGETVEIVNPESEIENRQELAVRWISYAVGIVLGRFTIGDLRFTNDQPPIQNRQSKIGNAIYRREDFAAGSLPAPDEAEFDQLVGPVERFAYVDADGGRHFFPAEVEAALRDLALPDGIAMLDEGHERDLPALVERALMLMLDVKREDVKREEGNHASRFTHHATPNTEEVIKVGAGSDLRKFLSRDFFTRWHLRWYRKRPVYWPLQSARRNYGFVLFHERVDKATLYVLQRDYLDHKLNGLRLQIGDLRGQAESLSGAARKRVERQIDGATQQLDEITEFAGTMERAVREGYEPEPNWIDDGVILRLAPLWELIPIWKREPKKYWERLEQGDYDWSHIAMRYWPERVREKCRTNKSFAIAHGHEEWYEGE